MDASAKDADGIRENHRHNELLAWATTRIDQLTGGECARQQLCEMLDWMAHFTREHFGFQQRLRAECSRQREYLLNRAAVHGEFRRQLARLCIDSTRGDPSVPERLRALCHQLLADAQAEQAVFADLVGTSGKPPRLRADRRRRPLASEAPGLFGAHVPQRAAH